MAVPSTLGIQKQTVAATSGLACLYFYNALLLGADAAAVHLENPFKYMPLQDLCDSTQRDVHRALDEHKMLLGSAAKNAGKPPPPGALKAALGPKGRSIPKAKTS